MKKNINEEYFQNLYKCDNIYKGSQYVETLHYLFEKQAAENPDRVALLWHGLELTYKELNEKSNQLAHYIRGTYQSIIGQPLKSDTIVALVLDRGLEMVVGILAVLKAGGAFVPIDSTSPGERVHQILKDTNTKLILSQKHLETKNFSRFSQAKVVNIDLQEKIYNDFSLITNLLIQYNRNDLAYVIYTSGTTGVPKGVMIEHVSLINLITSLLKTYNIESCENFLLFSNYVFDASIEQLFLSLSSGGKLYIIDNDSINDIRKFSDFIIANQITHLDATPSYLNLIDPKNFTSLKRVIFGAEFLHEKLLKKYKDYINTVYNVYGATETTISSLISINTNFLGSTGVDNTSIYILDSECKPVQTGDVGELFIGGAGLSRGYLNLPDLTSERFIPNPFATENDQENGYIRLYRTGDMVKKLANGKLEYFGRNDEQVKIRGFRVELGEIEHAMMQVEGIRQVCVLAKEKSAETTSAKYLVAYYTLNSEKENISDATILNAISKVLPEYMLPSILIPMESFPLTINGKLDKRSLPDPSLHWSSEIYVAPQTETEMELCFIWEELLGVKRIGITDNFFKIGGNSILAIQASHRMSMTLGYDIKVADMFRCNDISCLLSHTSKNVQLSIPVVHTSRSSLSYSQERLWFIEQYEEGTNAYHLPEVYAFDSGVNLEAIRHALQQIVSRHEVLRSTIEQDIVLNQGVQVVHQESLVIEDIHLNVGEDYHPLVNAEVNRPFDLSKEYPIRARFYHDASEQKTILLINTHHIASDGWSTDLFEQELSTCYEAYVKGDKEFKLPALGIQYKDYAIWQRSYLSGVLLEKQLSYWKEKLSGYQTLEFPTDYVRPGKIDYRGAHQEFTIDISLSEKLKALAQKHGLTLNTVMLSAMSILLGKYTGQDDIIIGSLMANRHHRQTENLIGFFVNTQASRIFLSPHQSFEELLLQVHREQIEAQEYQDLPFEKLVDALNVERDTSRHPVFQILFGVQNFGSEKNYLKTFQLKNIHAVSQFDTTIFIDDSSEALRGQISYATSLFSKERMERFAKHYTYLLEQLIEAPEKAYAGFGLLDAVEYQQILHDWNATEKAYPKDKTIHCLFEEQVARTPESIALVFEGRELSYRELNEKSNQLARQIRKEYQQRTNKELNPDTLIAMCLDRSLEMVIGILAVLKAGGAYVPIDPNYPQERIEWMLEDTGTVIVLSLNSQAEDLRDKLPSEKVMYIDLSEFFYRSEEHRNLPVTSKPEDLAYVLYTSGTTGKPKGVMIEHFSLCNRIMYMIACSEITASNYYVFKTNYVFDVSFSDIFAHLCAGAKLQITKHLFDIDELSGLLAKRCFTSLHLVPSQYELIASAIRSAGLEKLYFSGEALTEKIIHDLDNNIKIYNYYGPTETGEITLHRPLLSSEAPVIGKLFPNSTHYVLSSNLTPVPEGIIGELYIGGDGLARGYLNLEDLTNERFIPNPFATEADKTKGHTRLYKTGDLVRFLQNGDLHYVGRNDGQVKINGFRIELAEIEHALLNIPGIRQACILAKERKSETGTIKYLVAWYTLDPQHSTLEQIFIESRLSEVLPEHMIPATFIEVESFPLTVNGKLDKRALPEPDFKTDVTHIKPETELETELCHIYSDVLGLAFEQVSTHQNFFKIGGNSILSIKLKQRLNQVAEFKHISVADLFKYNSISKLIQSIHKETSSNYHLQKDQFHASNHEIAIIGMSGAFSGADNLKEFWNLIAHQKEGTRFYDKDECIRLQVDDSLLMDPGYIPVVGTVKDIDMFDPLFWDISPNEAKQLDPQIRKFLEHCWQVLEASGYIRQRKEQQIGVFAGNGNSTYFQEHILNGEMSEQINFWEASASNSKDALATKVAFLLGLTGPANSINTGCSTSLVTVVEACQKLRLGICNLALAGGVSLAFPDQIGYVYQEGMIYSKDGHCRTFDKDASGTTGGSGVGVVLLKRLDEAVRDKDNILAVIKGYATNNDGDRKTGYTAPSVIGQSECILNAQKMAGVYSNQIDYVECHGTATHLGDPIEVQALKEAFEYNRSKEATLSDMKTILGAVKANIGHTDAAAGVAGLIKVCTMLKHHTIPGQVNFSEPNSELNIQDTGFEIVKENRAWLPRAQQQRLAGISSFGVGGTNAHIIIGDYPEQKTLSNDNLVAAEADDSSKYIIPLSAKSRLSLENYKKVLLGFIENEANRQPGYTLHIRDIAYGIQEKKEHFSYRSAYCVGSIEELRSLLTRHTTSVHTHAESNTKIVFMFPGQGSQYSGMAKELYHYEPAFRSVVDQCIKIANCYLETNLFDIIYPAEQSALITETQWAQISLFIIEYALAKFLNTMGIQEDAYIGHSIGEYVAATLSGVFSLEDAIRLVIKRGQLMQAMEPGAMLSVNTEHATAMTLIKDSACEIAVFNTAEDVVVSGSMDAIRELKQKLDLQNVSSIKLNTSHAYHSRMMERAANEFEDYVHTITLNKPNRYFISNLTGEMATEEVLHATYWSDQLRHMVQFYKGINTISTHFNNRLTFIEVGTGRSLSSFVNKYKAAGNIRSVETMPLLPGEKEAKQSDRPAFGTNCKEDLLARLWEYGLVEKPNNASLFRQAKPQWNMPVYQFDSQKCWLEKGTGKKNKKMNPVSDMFYQRTWERIQSIQVPDHTFRHQHVLVMVHDHRNDSEISDKFVGILNNYFGHVSTCFHQPTGKPEEGTTFDFGNASRMKSFLDQETAKKPFDIIIYLSSSIDLADPGIDIFAIRNVFEWAKHTGQSINKIVSVSFDNYDVTGYEDLIQKPSVVYGVTKSIPFEYFTSSTIAFHVDLHSKDSNYKNSLIPILAQTPAHSLLAIRGRHSWRPVYKKFVPQPASYPERNMIQDGAVVLITGGLGALGYSYAKHISKKFKGCTFILTGRSTEEQLRPDYQERLEELRNTSHHIIYAPMDIGDEKSTALLEQILVDHHIHSLNLLLHAAGVAAKSALNEKSREEIMAVVRPKINGIEHLIKLSATIPINYLVCCSSEASILPSLGNMEYTAANLYLDEISYRIHSRIKKILSINLTQVSDTGMAIDFIKGLTTKHELSLNSIKSYEFPAIMETLLNEADCSSICLSRYDLNLDFNEARALQDSGPIELTGKIEVKVIEESYTESEYQIAKIFSEVLGIKEVSLHDDFFKLGGNSILAIRVSHRISQVLQCPVNVSDVFKNKTISNLKAIASTNAIDNIINIEEWTI